MEHNINDILGQMEEQPSPACWDRLSSRLDAAMPQQPQQPASGNTPAAVHKLHSLSAVWKAVATAAGVVAVAAATVTIYMLSRDNSSAPQRHGNDSATVQHDSLAEDLGDTINVVATTVADNNADSQNITTGIAEASPSTPPTTTRQHPEPEQVQTDKNRALATATPTVVPVPALSPATPALTRPIQPVHIPAGATNTPTPATHNLETTTQTEPQDSEDEVFPLEIPNVFTPNGDGYNDYFVIKGLEHCTNCQVVIRNQSGNVVFKSGNYQNNWGGDDCLDGVYQYKITYKMAGEDAQTVTGLVHILRR